MLPWPSRRRCSASGYSSKACCVSVDAPLDRICHLPRGALPAHSPATAFPCPSLLLEVRRYRACGGRLLGGRLAPGRGVRSLCERCRGGEELLRLTGEEPAGGEPLDRADRGADGL